MNRIQILKNEEIFILQIKMEVKLDLSWGKSERRRQYERKSDGKKEIGLILWKKKKKEWFGENWKLCRVIREKEEQEEKDNLNLQNNYGIKKPEEKQDEYYAEKVDK